MKESAAGLLARLQPVLSAIFAAYGVTEEEARRIVDETCVLLIGKRWDRHNPERWLIRTIIERCRDLALGSGEPQQDRPQ